MKTALARSMLDLMARLSRDRKLLRRSRIKPLTMDSTLFESRHVGRHFERRRRDTESKKSRDPGEKPSTEADATS